MRIARFETQIPLAGGKFATLTMEVSDNRVIGFNLDGVFIPVGDFQKIVDEYEAFKRLAEKNEFILP